MSAPHAAVPHASRSRSGVRMGRLRVAGFVGTLTPDSRVPAHGRTRGIPCVAGSAGPPPPCSPVRRATPIPAGQWPVAAGRYVGQRSCVPQGAPSRRAHRIGATGAPSLAPPLARRAPGPAGPPLARAGIIAGRCAGRALPRLLLARRLPALDLAPLALLHD